MCQLCVTEWSLILHISRILCICKINNHFNSKAGFRAYASSKLCRAYLYEFLPNKPESKNRLNK